MNCNYKKSDFGFALPEHLIAQHPLEERTSSRLLVLNDKKTIDTTFANLGTWLRPGDCLVINNTKVLPARLIGERRSDGALIELLLLQDKGEDVYECLVRPGKKCRLNEQFFFGNKLAAKVIDVLETGNRLVKFEYEGVFLELLEELGEMPLPPYIHEKLANPERYQTVYAKHNGSAAAPTAGLHFTQKMLDELKRQGIIIAEVTLHVGLGTFRPVKEELIESHHMHAECFEIAQEACDTINEVRRKGNRVIAVGTTSCRVLESVASPDGFLAPQSGETAIFISPGYRFKVIDGLITNFHLPESTLMMLVSALYGRQAMLAAYEYAIRAEYRFFSFGDAMLIIPSDKEPKND